MTESEISQLCPTLCNPMDCSIPSILAWKISWTEEPCGLQSMGSQRVKHNRLSTHIPLTLLFLQIAN